MSSKINGIEGSPIGSIGGSRAVSRPQDAVSGGGAAEASPNDGSQDVQITGTARQLAALEQKLRDVPALNAKRVTELRTAIEQGTYTVRPQHVADQLMSLERSLRKLPDSHTDSESAESDNTGQ